MPKNIELTLKELKAEAVKLGVPVSEADQYKTKAQVKTLINTLKAKETVQKVDELESPDVVDNKEDKDKWSNKAEVMGRALAKQPKVRMLLPLEPNEKAGVVTTEIIREMEVTTLVSGAYQPVTLNGFKTHCPKGVYFSAPEQIAKVLEKAHKQTSEAGKNFLIDREEKTQTALS